MFRVVCVGRLGGVGGALVRGPRPRAETQPRRPVRRPTACLGPSTRRGGVRLAFEICGENPNKISFWRLAILKP